MSMARITSRFSRTVLTQFHSSPVFFGRSHPKYVSPFTNQVLSLAGLHDTVITTAQVSLLHHSTQKSSPFQWFGFSSSATPQPNEKATAQSGNEQRSKEDNEAASAVDAPDRTEASITEETVEPDLDVESDLSRDDLLKLVVEKEQLLGSKEEELEIMKDKVLRTLAEMENVKERTRRESENAKKFAIQNFAKSLLDVADNLGRASYSAKESFPKIDASTDTAGAVQQLKTLLEGVEMTEKQLSEVFRKFGLEKYDPINEEFDPNRHNAVFQVPDASKPADHVAVVLKAGYMLHDRVIRPAEVGVTVAIDN
ncbi:Molecular chaperone of the GrpE family [Handroanthus impetiginosus]|uniref:GrpE protein homolog n=1 Tax=Handroanthus impetiginosus TaxID=429701 RepID=A0A2G9I075_9LAMI|nr:Molecular chaperone of the GrpE family [Handroanthus impetiginosus]